MFRPAFYYSSSLLAYDMGPSHPLKPARLAMTRDLLAAEDAFGTDGWLEEHAPRPATMDEAAAVHSREYLEELRGLNDGAAGDDAARFGLGTGDNPLFPGVWDASLLYAGATMCAAEHVLATKGRAVNIAGGLHHAHYNRAAGFCVLNDLSMAIARLLESVERVAYIDIDAHHGDGVQETFYADPRCLTISMHETGQTLFPGTGFADETGESDGEGCCINVPLRAGTGNETFLWAFNAVIPPAIAAYRPDVIVTQLGADAHFADPLAHLEITTQAYAETFAAFDAMNLPWLATGGGGYNINTVPRVWTMACAAMAGKELGDGLPDEYRLRYGSATLADGDRPERDYREAAACRAYAETSVREVEQRVLSKLG